MSRASRRGRSAVDPSPLAWRQGRDLRRGAARRVRREGAPRDQLRHLRSDLRALTRGRWQRVPLVVCSEAFAMVAFYRVNRAAFLAIGRAWSAFRTALVPLNPLLRIFVPCEIDYRADLGPGPGVLVGVPAHPV